MTHLVTAFSGFDGIFGRAMITAKPAGSLDRLYLAHGVSRKGSDVTLHNDAVSNMEFDEVWYQAG